MSDDRWRAAAAAAVNLREKSEPVLFPPPRVKPEPTPAPPARSDRHASANPTCTVKRERARAHAPSPLAPPASAPAPCPAPAVKPEPSAAPPPPLAPEVHVHVHAPTLSGAHDLIAPPQLTASPPPRQLAAAPRRTSQAPLQHAGARARSSDDEDIPLAQVARSLQQAWRWRSHVEDTPPPSMTNSSTATQRASTGHVGTQQRTRDFGVNERVQTLSATVPPTRRPRAPEAASPRILPPSQPNPPTQKRAATTPAAKATPPRRSGAGKAPRRVSAPERPTQSRVAAPTPAVTAPPLWRPCAVELPPRASPPPGQPQTRSGPKSAAKGKVAPHRPPRAFEAAPPHTAHRGSKDGATIQFASSPRGKLPSPSPLRADGASKPAIRQPTRRAGDAAQQHVASAVRPVPTPVRRPSPQRRARAEVESKSRMPAAAPQQRRTVESSSGKVQSERARRSVKAVRTEGQVWSLPDADDVVLRKEPAQAPHAEGQVWNLRDAGDVELRIGRAKEHPSAPPASSTASPQPVDDDSSKDDEYEYPDEEYLPPDKSPGAGALSSTSKPPSYCSASRKQTMSESRKERRQRKQQKKERRAHVQAARAPASGVSSPAAQSEAAVLRQVIRYGLLIIERSPSTGLPTWVACKLCAVVGCPGRRAGYIHAYRAPWREFWMLRHAREHTDVWPQYQRADEAGKIAFFQGKTLPEVDVFKNLVEFLKSIWTTSDNEMDVRKPALTGKENAVQNAGGSVQRSAAEPGESAKRRRDVQPMYQYGPAGEAYRTEMARRDMLSGQKRKAPVRAHDEHEHVMKKRL